MGGLIEAAHAASAEGQDGLAARALALRKAINGRRLRHDEWYQDQLRELQVALSQEPQNGDRYADLGWFLYEQASVRSERVEPRGKARRYRYQTQDWQQRELQRAQQLAEQALQLAPDDTRAMTLKAAVQIWYGQYAVAENLLRHTLQVKPDDPHALELFAQVLQAAAAQKSAAAADLKSKRSPHHAPARQRGTRAPGRIEGADRPSRRA
ncbi:MAG: tetratricopeptide repeat protein [Candidatus Schekmanbacteria bacterium]|nr:tetratricopeptide repeat protein [Candidatus Schekmanbacteria bacterium]